MMVILRLLATAAVSVLVTLGSAAPAADSAYAASLDRRAAAKPNASEALVVDLGYALYNGTADTTSGINSWIGIRYARSTEETRWQQPKSPHKNRSTIQQADVYAPNCPSGSNAPPEPDYNFTGSEDCLFLNVVAPNQAKNLPVLLYIHGGGYGQGSAGQDLTELQAASGNGFVGVIIQYRLAGFGFLSSADVQRHGVPNAGLYDQQFALKWVQKYIHLFGGNPNYVTIAGESAGGGSVMLQSMAMGGRLGESLFRNGIAASPYLPTQPAYNDAGPTHNYLLFAQTAGCYSGPLSGAPDDGSIFKCLVGTDSYTLQNASSYVSSSVLFGQWAFIPVTDGHFVQDLPSRQLEAGRVNGRHVFTTNNANEGVGFTPQNVSTEEDFVDFAQTIFPRFTASDITALLAAYPSTDDSVNPAALNYSTAGDTGATALNESTFGSGQQQRANNLYAEATFVCPSYWLADAFATGGKAAYRYQYSVIGAQHGADLAAYFGPPQPNYAPDFTAAVMGLWSRFVATDNPSVPASSLAALQDYPPWQHGPGAKMLDLNETGGTPYQAVGPQGIVITQFAEPGLEVDIREVDAWTWEGGRGPRCDVLKNLGPKVPGKR